LASVTIVHTPDEGLTQKLHIPAEDIAGSTTAVVVLPIAVVCVCVADAELVRDRHDVEAVHATTSPTTADVTTRDCCAPLTVRLGEKDGDNR